MQAQRTMSWATLDSFEHRATVASHACRFFFACRLFARRTISDFHVFRGCASLAAKLSVLLVAMRCTLQKHAPHQSFVSNSQRAQEVDET